jgi:hypothetical protein
MMFIIAASSRRTSTLGVRVEAVFVNLKNAGQRQNATSLPLLVFVGMSQSV